MDLQAQLARLRAKAHAQGPTRAPPLGERLARMRVGPSELGSSLERIAPSPAELASAVGGRVVAPGLVEIARALALPFRHGEVSVNDGAALGRTAAVVGRIGPAIRSEGLLFLDTETTGLAGGTGTAAFLVGAAWLEGRSLRLVQWLMAAFAAEDALIDRVAARFAASSALVTFNGKSFDLPLLRTRARLAGRTLDEIAHVDLLHVTRTLLRAGWPDCRLRTAETHALRLERSDDLPGSEAPGAWRRWLAQGDARLLGRVVEHNQADLLSLVGLLTLLERPTEREAPLLHALR